MPTTRGSHAAGAGTVDPVVDVDEGAAPSAAVGVSDRERTAAVARPVTSRATTATVRGTTTRGLMPHVIRSA
jgi:hypothetical protein